MEGVWRNPSMNPQYLQHPVILQDSNDPYFNAEWMGNRGSMWQDAGRHLAAAQVSSDITHTSMVPFQRNEAESLRFQQVQFMNFTSGHLASTGQVPIPGYAGVMSHLNFEDSKQAYAQARHLEVAKIEGPRELFAETASSLSVNNMYPEKPENRQIPSNSLQASPFTGYPFADPANGYQGSASPSVSNLNMIQPFVAEASRVADQNASEASVPIPDSEEGNSTAWHDKLVLLQHENTELKGRVDSLNRFLKDFAHDEFHEGGMENSDTQAWMQVLNYVDELDEKDVGLMNPMNFSPTPSVENRPHEDMNVAQANSSNRATTSCPGKRELIAMNSCEDSTMAYAEGSSSTSDHCHQENKRARLEVASSQKEVLLVFDGDLATCDRSVISNKLNRLKRLLTKRFEARGACAVDGIAASALQLLTRILLAVPAAPYPLPSERIRVMMATPISAEIEARLRSEILQVCAFVSDLVLEEQHIRFVQMVLEEESPQEESSNAGGRSHAGEVQVVVVGFNHGYQAEQRIDENALSEICQPESVAWSLCGTEISIGWVQRDMQEEAPDKARDTCGHVVVCNASRRDACITMFYPSQVRELPPRSLGDRLQQLAAFFADSSLHKAFESSGFLGKVAVACGGFRQD
eukprot:760400-Hanusia_phi.AAC.11